MPEEVKKQLVLHAYKLFKMLKPLETLAQDVSDSKMISFWVYAAQRDVDNKAFEGGARVLEQLPDPCGCGLVVDGSTEGCQIEGRYLSQVWPIGGDGQEQ